MDNSQTLYRNTAYECDPPAYDEAVGQSVTVNSVSYQLADQSAAYRQHDRSEYHNVSKTPDVSDSVTGQPVVYGQLGVKDQYGTYRQPSVPGQSGVLGQSSDSEQPRVLHRYDECTQPRGTRQHEVTGQPGVSGQYGAYSQPGLFSSVYVQDERVITEQPRNEGQNDTEVMGFEGRQGQKPAEFMKKPHVVSDCPLGLEYLIHLDKLHLEKISRPTLTSVYYENRYFIKNDDGHVVYMAEEVSDYDVRQLYGPARGFFMFFKDSTGENVMKINRESKMCIGCSCCIGEERCVSEIEIEAPYRKIAGYVRHVWSCLAPKFSIRDENQQELLTIKGPNCDCEIPWKIHHLDYIVYSSDVRHEVGRITKEDPGLLQEIGDPEVRYIISFPVEMDVEKKALILGAAFLIDYLFFEKIYTLPRRRRY